MQNKKKIIKDFTNFNKKSFLLKYIKNSQKKISLSFTGISHKDNIEYSKILKNINENKMCMLLAKNNLTAYLLKYIKFNKIKSCLTILYSINFFFFSITQYFNLLKIKENNSSIFFYFLIRNKIFLNESRIKKIEFYKNLLIFGFANLFYHKNTVLCHIQYVNNLTI